MEIFDDCKLPYAEMEILDVIEHIVEGGYPVIDKSWEIASILESIFTKKSGIEEVVSELEEMERDAKRILSYGGDEIEKAENDYA